MIEPIEPSGRNGNGGGLLEGALLERRAISRRIRNGSAEETTSPESARRAAIRSWAWAISGGAIFSFLVFAFLALIQPSFQGNERIAIPEAIRVTLEPLRGDRRPPASKRREEPRAQEEVKKVPRSKPRAAAASKSSRIEQAQPVRMRSEMQALQGILAMGGIGPGSGGAGIQISLPSEDQELMRKQREMGDYQRKREMIRSGQTGRAARAGPGGRAARSSGIALRRTTEEPYMPSPAYPVRALKEQKNGYVVIKLLISITGKVEKHEILAAEPPGYFEQAIIDVLPRWQFPPAIDENGRPIEHWGKYRYEFELEDAAS